MFNGNNDANIEDEVKAAKEKKRQIENGEADYDKLYLNSRAKDDLIKFSVGAQDYWGRVEDEEITIHIEGDLMFSTLREGDKVPEEEVGERADQVTKDGEYIKETGWAKYYVEFNDHGEVERKERRKKKSKAEKINEALGD
jgi:hypothetical protein